MSNDPTELCSVCGGTMQLKGGPGRFINFRRGVRLEIPADLKTMTCADCGDMLLDGPTADAIEARLGAIYEIRMRQPQSMQAGLDVAKRLPPNSLTVVGEQIEIRGRSRGDAVPANAPLHAA